MSTDTFEDELRSLLHDTADAEGSAYVDVDPNAVVTQDAGSSAVVAWQLAPASLPRRRHRAAWAAIDRVAGGVDRACDPVGSTALPTPSPAEADVRAELQHDLNAGTHLGRSTRSSARDRGRRADEEVVGHHHQPRRAPDARPAATLAGQPRVQPRRVRGPHGLMRACAGRGQGLVATGSPALVASSFTRHPPGRRRLRLRGGA